jgi:hypothetical protein
VKRLVPKFMLLNIDDIKNVKGVDRFPKRPLILMIVKKRGTVAELEQLTAKSGRFREMTYLPVALLGPAPEATNSGCLRLMG